VKSRTWEGISPAYRARLERGGITRQAYESGAKVTAARGHGATPEHPRDAVKRPERFPAYQARSTAAQRRAAYQHMLSFKDWLETNDPIKWLEFNEDSIAARIGVGMTDQEIDRGIAKREVLTSYKIELLLKTPVDQIPDRARHNSAFWYKTG
jgi:hypothetical protein